jgi:hypothetical protein
MGKPLDSTIVGSSMHHMKILDTPDSQTFLTEITKMVTQIHAIFSRFYDNPIPNMQRWFNQPAHVVALETVDFKQQWIEMVDSA